MDTGSNENAKERVIKDIWNIYNYSLDVKKFIKNQVEDTVDYMHSLIAEIPQSVPDPSTTKTSKVLKEKDYRREETIPEDDIIHIDNTVTDSAVHDKTEHKDVKTGDVLETTIDRTKKKAAIKPAINIKKQQSLGSKLQRLTLDDDSNVNRKRGARPKKTEIADTVIAPTRNDIEELSMCEDAFEKFTPLMNSTMDLSSTYTISPIKLNETVVINKNLASSIGKNKEPKFTSRSPITLQEEIHQLEQAMRLTEFEELFAEDEPSPEGEMSDINIAKQGIQNEMKRNARESNVLFDAQVPVKSRVEAFERTILKSRRETETLEKGKISEKAIVQKLARKSIEKAKKILLAKEKKENQMMTSQAKYDSKQEGPITSVLHSKPDDDKSDDESRPRHTIPH